MIGRWIYIAAILITVFIIVVGNLISLWYRVKCFKIKKCSNRKCRYRMYCHKYKEIITQEDRERIQNLIDQL